MKSIRALAASAAIVGVSLVGHDAQAACGTAGPEHVCVSYDGTAYTVDVGNGPVSKGPIAMDLGTTYTFELDPDSTTIAAHPFYLTDSATGNGAGVRYTNPVGTGVVNFTPGAATPATIHYQSSVDTGIGGVISVAGGGLSPDGGSTPSDGGTTDGGVTPSDGGASSSSSSGSGGYGGGASGSSTPGGGSGGCSLSSSSASSGALVLAAVLASCVARRRDRRRSS